MDQSVSEIFACLEKTNQIALHHDWQTLANETLDLLCALCQAEAGLLRQHSSPAGRLAWCGCPQQLTEEAWTGLPAQLLRSAQGSSDAPQWLELDQVQQLEIPEFAREALHNLLIIPIQTSDQPAGCVMLVNCASPKQDLAGLVLRRMTTEMEKALRVEASAQREVRLKELNDILGQLGATLNPDQVLRTLIEEARKFLQVEAVSLFLIDPQSGDLVLQVASQSNEQIQVEQVRVPPGKGIIGCVVETGETVLVEDVRRDSRHYGIVDKNSGFKTHSILAVPLRTRQIDLGQERGTSSERIIGGLEAINKLAGPFQPEDAEMLQTLAKGAATVMVVAQLYVDANNLFLDVIQALVAAIDAKDPYTVGHSQRVSDYSAEIARELGLTADEVYHTRLGSLFHDVGKIGVPDQILGKDSKLSPEELKVIQRHPVIGTTIMRTVHLMKEEIPAMANHHERLDGTGYPGGLHGEQIPLISRIVAVADVFDAMTSNRPYRAALPVREVFDYLKTHVGTYFDDLCVTALIRAYQNGRVQTQVQRAELVSQV